MYRVYASTPSLPPSNSLMNVESRACPCCSCDAVRMSVENGVLDEFMKTSGAEGGRESGPIFYG